MGLTTLHDIAYILDLGSIDSVIACEYLFYHIKGRLQYVILHQQPINLVEQQRLEKLQNLFAKASLLQDNCNIEILDTIPLDTKTIICGAPYTKLFKAMSTDIQVDYLIGCGGYGGLSSQVKKELKLNSMLDFTSDYLERESKIFNQDLYAIHSILSRDSMKKYQHIQLYGENVGADFEKNNPNSLIWQYDEYAQYLFDKYNIKDETKRGYRQINLNYTLMVHEALAVYDAGKGGAGKNLENFVEIELSKTMLIIPEAFRKAKSWNEGKRVIVEPLQIHIAKCFRTPDSWSKDKKVMIEPIRIQKAKEFYEKEKSSGAK